MNVETPDDVGAFPRLSDAQVATLAVGGARRAVRAGETLVRAGAPSDEFFVILSGTVAIVDDDAGERQVLRIHARPGSLGGHREAAALIAGGLSVALAQTFVAIAPKVKNPGTAEWSVVFEIFHLLL
jgi:hypothetical protein